MNISELQVQLHIAIDTITDSKKLEAIYTLLKGEKGPYTPMSLEDYTEAIDEAKEQIKEGKFLSTDQLEKDSENW